MINIDALISRVEMNGPYPDDGPILLEALKSAAQAHTKPSDILTFLRFHIERGYDSYKAKQEPQGY
jgi:hypothetical protein